MKYNEYVKKIEDDEYDFDAGMLSQLEVDVPDGLHNSIMKSIEKERIRRRNAWYRTFSSIAAAVIIFVISIVGLKDTLKAPTKSEDKSIKNNSAFIEPKKQEIKSQEIKISKNLPSENKINVATKDEKGFKIKGNITSQNKKSKVKTSSNEKRTFLALNNKKETVINEIQNTKITSDVLTKDNTLLKSENTEEIDTQEIQMALTLSQINNINFTQSRSSLMTNLLASALPIDYIAKVDKNQKDVISFINNNPNVILIDLENGIYRVQRQDFNVLCDMINSQRMIYNEIGINEVSTYSENYIREFYFVKIVIK
ncbi:MAG: hypothetical protein N2448_08885 [Caloramator sp.]|nr:hypothetical protein [Caloramator sp.]